MRTSNLLRLYCQKHLETRALCSSILHSWVKKSDRYRNDAEFQPNAAASVRVCNM